MLQYLTTKSKKSPEEKDAEMKKAQADPLNYKRRDPPMYNPFNHLALAYAYHTSPKHKTYKQTREMVSRRYHGIPTTEDLRGFIDKEEAKILSEAERQFRSQDTEKPVRRGYEFQILQ